MLVIIPLSVLFPSCASREPLLHFDAVAASCTEAGNIEYWQNEAGERFDDVNAEYPIDPFIPASGHDYQLKKVMKGAVCTQPGTEIYQCKRCGEILEKKTAPSEHVFYAYRVTTPPSCTKDGEECRICAFCEMTEKRVIPATGHVFGTDNLCTVCSFEIIPTQGLVYRETKDLDGDVGYFVTGCEKTVKDLVIAKYHDGIPIIGVENDAFFGCIELGSLNVYADLTSIGQNAFRNCISLRSVTIPDSVERIGINAFYGCSALTSIHLGSGVTEIGQSAFVGCCSLKEITVSEKNRVFRGEGNCLMKGGTLVLGSVVAQVPSSATEIGAYAFYGMEGLKTVMLPVGIKKIGTAAFCDCIGLSEIIYEGTAEQWSAIEFGKNWCKDMPNLTVRCLDGDIMAGEA